MTTLISVDLPIKTGAGLNDRMHWRARARKVKAQREGTRLALFLNRCNWSELPLPLGIRLIRLSAGVLDSDNLQGSLKAIRDGVADAFGLPDNSPQFSWSYGQERVAHGKYGVRIEISATDVEQVV